MSFISAAEADKNTYDVIVVGSGAAGGQTAYTLTMDGARVLMLEAGRNYQPATETPMMQTNAEAPLRGGGTPEKPIGTVCLAWLAPDGTVVSETRHFPGGREAVRRQSVVRALNGVLLALSRQKK